MNPEQAKAAADLVTSQWEDEIAATVRVLSAVTDAGRDYRPDPKSRTAWEIASHLASADAFFTGGILEGQFGAASREDEHRFKNTSDLVAFYESTVPANVAKFRALSGEQLLEDIDFFGRMIKSRVTWIGFSLTHSIHHRGQLSAYLRPMGSRVPSIYGPSADTEFEAAS